MTTNAPSRRARREGPSPWAPSSAFGPVGPRPSKVRGQNFLVQAAIADRIVGAAELKAGDEVVEIGPGLGILSERIAAHGARRLVLVELDSRLAERLRQRFAVADSVKVIDADFLRLDLDQLGVGGPLKVLGNLPFGAASAIFRRLCEWRDRIARMVLMFQREVAERLRARPGERSHSALSLYTAMYWEIESHFRVTAGNFYPKPRVDAEVLVFRPTEHPRFKRAEEGVLLDTIRAAFSSPRKTLRNALATGLRLSPAQVECALAQAAIDPSVRAATLSLDDFVRLARELRPDA